MEGCPQVSAIDLSELFQLLSTLYIPEIHLIIRSWIEAGSKLNIPVILVPFESTTRRQVKLSDWFGKHLPGNQTDDLKRYQQAHTEAIEVNLSQTKHVRLSAIAPAHTANARTLLNRFFPDRPEIQPLIDYISSDLQTNRHSKVSLPLFW